eukprot:GCRY01001722.1.p1 GENE.GCRY01001722.1~~GCRY01001722.1.p1  ORF type:complete len:642 (+),score=79.46 GCRY01001722.1:199-2124(+)
MEQLHDGLALCWKLEELLRCHSELVDQQLRHALQSIESHLRTFHRISHLADDYVYCFDETIHQERHCAIHSDVTITIDSLPLLSGGFTSLVIYFCFIGSKLSSCLTSISSEIDFLKNSFLGRIIEIRNYFELLVEAPSFSKVLNLPVEEVEHQTDTMLASSKKFNLFPFWYKDSASLFRFQFLVFVLYASWIDNFKSWWLFRWLGFFRDGLYYIFHLNEAQKKVHRYIQSGLDLGFARHLWNLPDVPLIRFFAFNPIFMPWLGTNTTLRFPANRSLPLHHPLCALETTVRLLSRNTIDKERLLEVNLDENSGLCSSSSRDTLSFWSATNGEIPSTDQLSTLDGSHRSCCCSHCRVHFPSPHGTYPCSRSHSAQKGPTSPKLGGTPSLDFSPIASPVSESPKMVGVSLFKRVILHVHGGGFIAMSVQSSEVYLREIAASVDAEIISIEIHPAPESRFPVQIEEGMRVYRWLRTHTAAHITLMGDSAGGNIVAAMTLQALQEGLLPPNSLVLIYPALDLSRVLTTSRALCHQDTLVSHAFLELCLRSYLGRACPLPSRHPLVSPLYASTSLLSQFPPTIIFGAGFDPLLDETVLFHSRLQRAGADARLRVFDGLPHGWLNLGAQIPEAKTCVAETIRWIKAQE